MKTNNLRNTNYDLLINAKPKVALLSDWIIGGGSERVVYELHKLYPDAPIYTTYCSDEWRQKLDGAVVTGYLQHLGKVRKFLPLLQQWWFKSLNLDNYDVIISCTGNGQAKAITKPDGTTHISFCYTPVHYFWRHYATYIKNPGFGVFDPIARIGLKLLVNPLRKADYKAAQEVDYFIGISKHIQADIKKYYNRSADIIYPPVNTERFKVGTAKREGFITIGRLATIKRTDVIVDACTKLNVSLTVIGKGPDLEKLKTVAGPTVRFLSGVSDADIAQELQKAEAFLFASYEDFGIAPVEAMAAGTPVVAFNKGGALDYVNKDTGVFFDTQTAKSMIAAIKKAQSIKWDHAKIAKSAQKFSAENFRQNISKYIDSVSK